jgi:hypothetical protein
VKPCDNDRRSVTTYDVRVESGIVMLRVDAAVSNETVAAA